MRFSTIVSTLIFAAAVSAQQNITVVVGSSGGLTYTPSSVTAKAGDTISFQFQSKNHTAQDSKGRVVVASSRDYGWRSRGRNALGRLPNSEWARALGSQRPGALY
jgi:plastocyanin